MILNQFVIFVIPIRPFLQSQPIVNEKSITKFKTIYQCVKLKMDLPF